ncbi:MAG: L-ribulose-5-phosphate 4-epimerase AraD [Kiritimatiellae bacterium]|nr:L-ribulose-5-phosphate 4-epimerase AraD [Kiritimatiellia bacterium]
MLDELKRKVYRANMRLVEEGLVVLTWGNVSERDPETGFFVIKPSGVPYALLKPRDMVVVNMEGHKVEGECRPSSDTPTHLAIYRAFGNVGGVVHTHSIEAVAWAQAGREIPCYGTTHADQFHGPVPITRALTEDEVKSAYELNTGKVIVERFEGSDPLERPGALVPGHGPFTWGADAFKAVDNAVALEAMARMARLTEQISTLGRESVPRLPGYVAEKHYSRKHGPNAYYGQK